MNIRERIRSTFDDRAFDSALYYSYEKALRFELAEDESRITNFLTAHRKAMEICSAIFEDQSTISVCIMFYGKNRFVSSLSTFRELRRAGISFRREVEYWFEPDEEDDDLDEKSLRGCHYIAFEAPKNLLSTLLWFAIARESCVGPNPDILVRLFNFSGRVMAHPYDDRGLDVVGHGHELLSKLYSDFYSYLLEYDIDRMDEIFSQASQ